MSEATTGTVTNPTDPPAAPAAPVTPPATPVVDAGKPQEPSGDGKTLLAEKPAEGDPKPADPKPAEPAKPADAKPEGAPEKYEFKDADKFDAGILGAFSEGAKEANLTLDAAQKLLDKVAPAIQARTEEQVKAVHQQWTEASTADKEFGGDKLKENLGVARKALDQFGTPELKAFLDTSGLGNHPDVIRLLFRVGKAISEDGVVTGSPSGKSAVNPATVLYDNTTRKE